MSNKMSFNVSMYRDPPEGKSSCFEQRTWAMERIKLYRILEYNKNITADSLKTLLCDSPLKLLLANTVTYETLLARKIDKHSHWFLRLAYVNEPNAFIKYEMDWFKLRFNCLLNIAKNKFMEANNLIIQPIGKEPTNDFMISIIKLLNPEEWYKIKISEITSLLIKRKHVVKEGYMYVPREDIVYWILEKFEENLKVDLIRTKNCMQPQHEELLKITLVGVVLVKPPVLEYALPYRIQLENVDDEAERNFPLCMRFQHETLRRTHHLKYFSRMEYGLFLKGLGLGLTEALEFWKKEFLHNMDEERFNKRYSYLFKHQYGTVGGKINWSPYTCEKIQADSVNLNQVHGCPFKTWDGDRLGKELNKEDINKSNIAKIITMKNEGKYSEACARYFECRNLVKFEGPLISPNQYFQRSCHCYRGGIQDIEDIGMISDESSDY